MANGIKIEIEAAKRVIAAITDSDDCIDLTPFDPDLSGSTKGAERHTSWIDYGGRRCLFLCKSQLPDKALKALSKLFATEIIRVRYASEDIGYTCGKVSYYAGNISSESYRAATGCVTDAEDAEWKRFAETLWRVPHGPRCEWLPAEDDDGDGEE